MVSIYSFCLFVKIVIVIDHRFDHHAGGRTKARHCLGSERLQQYYDKIKDTYTIW